MGSLPTFWIRSRSSVQTLKLLSRLRPFSASAGDDAGGGVAVKKVTRSNFEPALEDLRTRVREADFVAVDLEMTGITSAPWRDSFEFDRSDVRYLKLKDSAEKFAVVQFGVCPFRWDASQRSFVAQPHNFYIFPRKELPVHGPSSEILWQTTSIEFLAKYQFDFNTCIHEASSHYLRIGMAALSTKSGKIFWIPQVPHREQEAEALEYLSLEYHDQLANSFYNLEEYIDMPIMRTSDVLVLERMKKRFHEWRDAILRSHDKGCTCVEYADRHHTQFQTFFFKMRPAIMLHGFSSHQLKLIQLVLRKHFKDLVYVRYIDENCSWQRSVVYVDTDEDKASLMKEVQKDLRRNVEEKVRSAIGFRHVVDLLASEGKLIVGHNCLLDLAHIYSKFFGSLPSTLVDFVLAVHEKFPHIIDTRHLLNSSQAIQYLMKKRSKSLSSAFSLLCPNVLVPRNSISSTSLTFVVETDESESSCFNSGAKHEAGYDAFMTGCVFAQVCSHMGIKFDVQSDPLYLSRNDKIKNYINVLYPSWNSGTVIHLNTGNEIPEPGYKRKYPAIVFQNTVLLWQFPSKLKPNDLKECIYKVFGPDSLTSVFFIDRTSALIQFRSEEFANKFMALKDSLERNVNSPVTLLHPLDKLLEGGRTRAADYDTYRDICATSRSEVLFADQADSIGFRWKTKIRRGSQDFQDVRCNNTHTEDSLAVKYASVINSDPTRRQISHQLSSVDALDSLSTSKSLLGKAMRST